MIKINHPVLNMLDTDRVVEAIGELKTEDFNVLIFPKGESMAGVASMISQAYIITEAYTLSIQFMKDRVRIVDTPYNYIPETYIYMDDVDAVDIQGRTIIFYVTDGSKYGLKESSFSIDLDDLRNSTPEILNTEAFSTHPYRDRRIA